MKYRITNWKKINIIRASIQLIFFLLTPAIFSIGFGGIKALTAAVRAGELSGISVSIKVAILLLVITAVFGRFFCGWVCSFGAYGDLIYGLTGKFTKKYFLKKKRDTWDEKLKLLKYIFLLIILVLYVLGMQVLIKGTSPWDVFGQLISFRPRLSGYIAGVVFLILITIGSAFIERFYCRYFCAFGACFALFARFKALSLGKPRASCAAGCRLCSEKCPMGIDLNEKDEVPGAECIRCLRCTNGCRKQNMHLKFGSVTIPDLVYIIFMTGLMLLLLIWLGLIRLG